MCIIVVKPAGEDMPSEETMRSCWNHNPDGAGFMYNDGNTVRIEKGFMDWTSFVKRLQKLSKSVDFKSKTMVFHFRIATHGEVSRECCHPFPVSSSLKDLRKCKANARVGVAHNGIIAGQDTNNKKSDTMNYIMTVITPLYAELGASFAERKNIKALIENTISGSRMVFLLPDGTYHLIGRWSLDNGCCFSNDNYKFNANWAYCNFYDFDYDYEDDSDDFYLADYSALGMRKPPSDLCEGVCPDYEMCILAREWYCLNEDEALDNMDYFLELEQEKENYKEGKAWEK